MSCTKPAATPPTTQQRETFTISLTKRMVKCIKAELPQRYSLHLYSKKNDRNISNSSNQSEKNSDIRNKSRSHSPQVSCDTRESRQNAGKNLAEVKVEEIQQSQYLASLKQKNVPQSQQIDINMLKDSIVKFFEVMHRSLKKGKELDKSFHKMREKFSNDMYKNLSEFEKQIESLKKLISSQHPNGKALSEFDKISKPIQSYFKCVSDRKKNINQPTSKVQTKKQVPERKISPNLIKDSKVVSKSVKTVQKQLISTKGKNKFNKKYKVLPEGLFQVAQETQSSINNSNMMIDSFEAASINQLLRKLHRFDQQQLLKTLGSNSQMTLIKNLSRKKASDFVAKIKRMLRKNGYKGFIEENDVQSSFEVENDE